MTKQNQLEEAVEGNGGGYQVLSIEEGPTCSTPLQNPTAIEERQHISFPQKDPTTFSSIRFKFEQRLYTSSSTTLFYI